ncbi:MAG: glycosyltransferase family 4 protein [Proteobacteria bacterium]|nr:glycosyltransferase family 4 protein [Pseudomonadota bacterium]
MNIVLINHYAGSTRHGMEFRPYYLAREWVRAGHRVQVLSASFSHVRTHQPDLGDRSALDETIDGIDYRWYRTPAYQGNGIGRVVNMLSFLHAVRRDARRIAREVQPDVVIASSTYPMDIKPARKIAKLSGAKLVYEVHDLWPLSPMELGGMSKWHPFILWVQQAEDCAYRHADVVISMLPKTRDYMESRGLNGSKWKYVPNGVDEEEWRIPAPLPGEAFSELQRIRAKGVPVVGYTGTHGLANSLDSLLDAAREMQAEAEVVMVGTGPERERLLRRIRAECVANITMLPPVPKASIPALLEEVDIAFIGLQRQKVFQFGISPNKLLDYMMARKVVVMAIESGNDPVTESCCGRTVPPEDPDAIRRAIRDLSGMTAEDRAAMGTRGRAYVLANHTYPVLARRFIEALDHA